MTDLTPLSPGTLAVYNVSDKPDDITKLDADDVEGRDCLFASETPAGNNPGAMHFVLVVEKGGFLALASSIPGFLGTTNRGQSIKEFIDPKKSRWVRRFSGLAEKVL